MDKEKVLHLAKLARIEIEDEEANSLSHEFDAILHYVGEIRGADPASHTPFAQGYEGSKKATQDKSDYALKNVMREDSEPHESGFYTEEILEQAPAKEGGYIKVKKIL